MKPQLEELEPRCTPSGLPANAQLFPVAIEPGGHYILVGGAAYWVPNAPPPASKPTGVRFVHEWFGFEPNQAPKPGGTLIEFAQTVVTYSNGTEVEAVAQRVAPVVTTLPALNPVPPPGVELDWSAWVGIPLDL